jgi:hypothetical protein
MNTWVIFLIVVAAIAGFIYFLLWRKSKKKAGVLTNSVEIPYDNLLTMQMTEGGVTVRSNVVVPPEALAAIDRGIQHQITNSSHYNPGWTIARTLPEYQVFLIPPHTHNVVTEPGSPALLVKYLTMAGTVGEVQTAGTCIGVDGAMFVPGKGPVSDPRHPSMVLPHQAGESWQYLSYLEESARNESEHLAEFFNDRTMFKSFAIVGDVHPHFEDWQ